jgi:hypothetical protein
MLDKIKKILSDTFIYKRINTLKKLNKLKKKKINKKEKKIKRNDYQIQLKIKNKKINFKNIVLFSFVAFIILITFIYNSSIFKIQKIEILRLDPRTNISIAYMAI